MCPFPCGNCHLLFGFGGNCPVIKFVHLLPIVADEAPWRFLLQCSEQALRCRFGQNFWYVNPSPAPELVTKVLSGKKWVKLQRNIVRRISIVLAHVLPALRSME